jgi:hypothetical protein
MVFAEFVYMLLKERDVALGMVTPVNFFVPCGYFIEFA